MTGEEYANDDAFGYDPGAGTYRVPVDGTVDSVPLAVIDAVAAVSGTEPTELQPLYAAVDPEALDRLFRPTMRGPRTADGRVAFEYSGYSVTVYSYGVVEVEIPDDGMGTDAR